MTPGSNGHRHSLPLQFGDGDTVKVHFKVSEGNRWRARFCQGRGLVSEL